MLRSDAEIAVIEALAAQGETVVALLDGGLVFRSRLRLVDPGRQFIVVDPSADAAANAALLARPRAVFLAEWGEWRIELAVTDPRQIVHEGAAAIRLRFPEAISSRRRRTLERVPVSPQLGIRWVADGASAISFEGTISDISHGGVGVLQYDPKIMLEPGMVLEGCRIERPGKVPAVVDLEVRYTKPEILEDGSQAQRAGCKFLNLSPSSIELILEFFGNKS
jgi:c-di-GMP-binding flagellar brake protein YcgR